MAAQCVWKDLADIELSGCNLANWPLQWPRGWTDHDCALCTSGHVDDDYDFRSGSEQSTFSLWSYYRVILWPCIKVGAHLMGVVYCLWEWALTLCGWCGCGSHCGWCKFQDQRRSILMFARNWTFAIIINFSSTVTTVTTVTHLRVLWTSLPRREQLIFGEKRHRFCWENLNS